MSTSVQDGDIAEMDQSLGLMEPTLTALVVYKVISLYQYKKRVQLCYCFNQNVMFNANRYDVLGNTRPKRTRIGSYKCDDDHWTRGHLYGGVEACQARCKGFKYMIHVPMGACACQNTCKEVVTNCAGPVAGRACEIFRLDQ